MQRNATLGWVLVILVVCLVAVAVGPSLQPSAATAGPYCGAIVAFLDFEFIDSRTRRVILRHPGSTHTFWRHEAAKHGVDSDSDKGGQ